MVKVGDIINTRGLKGDCKIYSSTDEPNERFQKGKSLFLKNGKELVIEAVSFYKDFPYIRFQGYDTLEKAETLRGESLWVDEKDLPALDEDTFYYRATCSAVKSCSIL